MGTLDERAAKETASAKAWRPVPFSQRAAVCAVGTTRYVVDYVADGAEAIFCHRIANMGGRGGPGCPSPQEEISQK